MNSEPDDMNRDDPDDPAARLRACGCPRCSLALAFVRAIKRAAAAGGQPELEKLDERFFSTSSTSTSGPGSTSSTSGPSSTSTSGSTACRWQSRSITITSSTRGPSSTSTSAERCGWILVIYPNGLTGVAKRPPDHPPTTEELQELVGGYIEVVPGRFGIRVELGADGLPLGVTPNPDGTAVVYVNEDGRRLNLLPNRVATQWLGWRGPVLRGVVVLVDGFDDDDDDDEEP